MYIRNLNIKDFEDVAKLETLVYPESMCLGVNDFVNDFNKAIEQHRYCYGAFVKGELVGYLVSFVDKESIKQVDWHTTFEIYVSDLVCINKRALMPLLVRFSQNIDDNVTVKAQLRETSRRIIKHIIRKYPELIKEYNETLMPNYYDGEDAFDVSFKIRGNDKRNDIKLSLFDYMNRTTVPNINSAINHLIRDYSTSEIIKYKNYILKMLYKQCTDAYDMMPGDLKYLVTYRVTGYRHNMDMRESFEAKLIENNPEMRKMFMSEVSDVRHNDGEDLNALDCTYATEGEYISWNMIHTFDNTMYNDGSLAYYRHFITKHLFKYEMSRNSAVHSITVLDKNGYSLIGMAKDEARLKRKRVFVPYINRIVFDNYVNQQILQQSLIEKFREVSNADYLQASSFLGIRKVIGKKAFDEFVPSLIERIKERALILEIEPRQFGINRVYTEEEKMKRAINSSMHDYLYVVYELESQKKYLTAGAMIKILSRTQEGMVSARELFSTLSASTASKMDTKKLRKEISSVIKNNGDLKEYIRELNIKSDMSFLKSKKMDKKSIVALSLFMEKMRKYTASVTAVTMFQHFGSNVKDIVSGKMEGLFNPCAFSYQPIEVGELVQKCLGNRGKGALVKHPMALFKALSKIADVKDIVRGNIYGEDINLVLDELKQRNIEVPKDLYNVGKLYAKIEPKCSPEFLTAGDASVCCMSFGQAKATDYALQKGFGIFNIYYKDRVIGNSVLWINEAYNCLVIDNVEVHPNYVHLNPFIKKLYFDMIKQTVVDYKVNFAVQGAGYNDLELFEDTRDRQDRYCRLGEEDPCSTHVYNFRTVAKDVISDYFYSDAQSCYIIELAEGFSMENTKEFIKESNKEYDLLIKKQYEDRAVAAQALPQVRMSPFLIENDAQTIINNANDIVTLEVDNNHVFAITTEDVANAPRRRPTPILEEQGNTLRSEFSFDTIF